MKTKADITRYNQVAEELRQQMRQGKLKPGDRLPSFAEMRAQGISQNTMEKVHSLLERENLVVRRHRLGTFVADRNEINVPRNGIIGVTGKGFSFKEYSSYWVKLLRGMREAADEAETQILLLDFKSSKGWENADGILICDWSNKFTMQWLPPQVPCVSVLVPADGMVSVYADDYRGGRMAAEYLLELGHRRIAHVHSGDAFVSARRLAGHQDALRVAGIKPNPAWERVLLSRKVELDFGARFIDGGRELMKDWLRSDWRKLNCTAIVAQNDETAVGIIEALRDAKIRVPEDVSVIGFDGADESMYATSQLTTVEVPLEEIGKTSVQLLLQQLNGIDDGPTHRVYPLAVKSGQSTARNQRK